MEREGESKRRARERPMTEEREIEIERTAKANE